MTTRRALTLIELLVTTMVIASVAVLVIPLMTGEDRARVVAASRILYSDIEYAQVMTISYPDDPVCVQFDVDNDTYWLAYADDPDTPINRPDTGEAYTVTLGTGRASTAAGVSFAVSDMTDSMITFDAHGGLQEIGTSPSITLTHGDRAIRLDIAATTGTITEVADPEEEEEGS